MMSARELRWRAARRREARAILRDPGARDSLRRLALAALYHERWAP